MKIPISWLAEYVPIVFSSSEIAHKLTMAGIESTYLKGPSFNWGESIVIGEVASLEVHPNADRLKLATVDIGTSMLTVVCGAPNIASGQKIALAKVGARLFDAKNMEYKTLSGAKIRGILSEGMVCSEMELGISNDHQGILVLPQTATIGSTLADYIDDDAIEVEVTPNRGDCLSVLGVAREIAAFSNQEITLPTIEYKETDNKSNLDIQIENPDLCARYIASIIRNITVAQSPEWLQRRLIECNQRPINAIVDVTNYVMLEMGQPLHAFDLDQIEGKSIKVRAASLGEAIQTLDGTNQTLEAPMCVIADAKKPIALAGIMGGQNSEVATTTTNILIEAATFNALNTRKTSNALKIRTEASTRFEKGLHPDLAQIALKRTSQLILQIAGGSADHGIIDVYPSVRNSKNIELSHEKIMNLLGVDFTDEQIQRVFVSLGFDINKEKSGNFMVSAPYWRTDISIEEDLVEEIARVLGYDSIPAQPLKGSIPKLIPQKSRDLREELRDLLVEVGLQEVITHTLVDSNSGLTHNGISEHANSLRILNPLSSDHQFLRTDLRSSILKVISKSVGHQTKGLSIFEIGRGFLPISGDLPVEKEMAVVCLAGQRSPDSLWSKQEVESYDFFDIKGMMEAIFSRLGIAFELKESSDAIFHPGKSADIFAGQLKLGVLGSLHPDVLSQLDIDAANAVFAELDINEMSKISRNQDLVFRNYSRFPVATRDLAFVVDIDMPANEIVTILKSASEVTTVLLFDQFTGEDLPAGKKSLAFRIELQSDVETLKSERINKVINDLVEKINKVSGGTLRA